MNLTDYLNQAEPKRKPIVNLSTNDYRVISETLTVKIILIPELETHFPGMTCEYYIRANETVCRVIKDGVLTEKTSCFYIN
jgi:hypothetical protein